MKSKGVNDDYDVSNARTFCAASEEDAINQAREYYPDDFEIEVSDFGNPGFQIRWPKDGNPGVIEIGRDPDVLDTWFSSGLWPFGTLGWPENTPELQKYFPGDVLITGQDILFFWVARMMMMSNAVLEENPFHTVYLHQLVRDAKGEKMSKTRGNVIDPLEMIDQYGADALRFSNAQMAALGGVLKISEDRIKGYRNFGTKIWNAFSFAQHYEVPFTGEATPPKAQNTLNKWIIGEVAKTREEVDAALTAYRFNDAANALYAFTWGKVCDWYVEFSKPILQGDDQAAIAETHATIAWVLDQVLILLHPIMPFITEELWQTMGAKRAKLLCHADWPRYTAADLVDKDADREMNWTIALIESVRSARAQMHVPAGLKIPMIVADLDAAGRAAWAANEGLIKRLARIDSLTEGAFPKGTITIPVEGGTFGLPLEGVIDINEEIARLQKSIDKLAKEIGGLKGRVNNPKFAASAPPEVVEEARQNLALREDEDAKLKEALARLEEI